MPSRTLYGVLAGSLIVAVLAGVIGSRFSTPQQVAADAQPPPITPITEPVSFGVLEASVATRAAIADASPIPVGMPTDLGSATPVITTLNVNPGEEVSVGDVLFSVAERPVIVLQGAIPSFRTMQPGDVGIDVKELQSNLNQLGYSIGSDALGTYGPGTAAAVSGWYAHLGYQSVSNPPDAEAQLHTLQTAVTTAQTTLTRDGAALTAAQAAADTSTGTVGTGNSNVAQLETTVAGDQAALDAAKQSLTSGLETMGATIPQGEVVFVPSLPQKLVELDVSLGATGTTKQPLAVIGSGSVTITASIESGAVSSVHPGESATGHSDVSGQSFTATVSAVASSPTTDSTTGQNVYAVVLTPTSAIPEVLIGQNVELSIQTASTNSKTWIVPVGAVITDANGSSHIVVAARRANQEVAVRTGLVSGGQEAVRLSTPGSLHLGDKVVIGYRH